MKPRPLFMSRVLSWLLMLGLWASWCPAAESANAPSLAWAIGFSSGTNDTRWDLSTWITKQVALPNGDCLISGGYYNSITLGRAGGKQVTLNYLNSTGYYLARYDADGQLIWARNTLADCPASKIAGMAVLPDGSIVATGELPTGAIVGGTWYVSGGMFMSRYDAGGKMTWVKVLPNAAGRGIAGLADGSIALIGRIGGKVRFGGSEPNATVLDPAVDGSMFLARYRPDGKLIWVKGIGQAWEFSFAALPDGCFAIAGGFSKQIVLGPSGDRQTTLTAPQEGRTAPYIARFHSDGTLAWAKVVEGYWDWPDFAVDILPDGGVVATGSGWPVKPAVNQPPTKPNAYVVRYQSDGQKAWERYAYGAQTSCGSAIDVRADGRILVTGYFGDTPLSPEQRYPETKQITFGKREPRQVTLNHTGYTNLFVACYQADGQLDWAWCPDAKGGAGMSITAMPDGSTMVGGFFVEQLTVNPQTTLTAKGTELDGLLLKLENPDPPVKVVLPNGGETFAGGAVAADLVAHERHDGRTDGAF